MGALMDSRVALARALAKLDQLPDIVADDYERGRHEREHQLRLLKLQSATQEVQARTVLLQAEQLLASLQPAASATTQTASARSPGLTPADVQQVVQQLPEISAETAGVLTRLLEGLLADRGKS
jgi:ParB-like chromosome segregation protein Spo0J